MDSSLTRRTLLALPALAAALPAQTPIPWYRRAYRWGQTNITENDPPRYDIDWWRAQWKRTEVQAVIINAGGIVAYYPSKFPLHYRAQFLNGRDLFGELTTAARGDGLFVMARMDSNRTSEDFYQAHPYWFTLDRNGNPYRAAEKYITCINSPYYDQYLPDVMREIITRSRPDGFTDNSWAGMGRENICYCANCKTKFGTTLPVAANWDDPAYRRWILWNYARRTELWEFNNRVTQAAGGPDCIWSGMNGGSVTSQANSFRDLREIARRAPILMLDHQRRDDDTGFQQNGDTGKRVHMIMGWDKLAPESMAMYLSRPGYYRLASQSAPEARLWMIAGLAGGIQPWWHHISAYHEDRRQYRTAEPVMKWAKANEAYLIDREPVATVGLLWSQRNTDFFGRDRAADVVDAPYTGFMHALIRGRIPYLPIHADDLDRKGDGLTVLILPNVGALSDEQIAAIRRFVSRGGSIFATGASSLYNEQGDKRPDYALADLFGAHSTGVTAAAGTHTYLRLSPELRAQVDGPKSGEEPVVNGAKRHAVLAGFEETDVIPYGGTLATLKLDVGVTVPLSFVPSFPTYPPETSWMREPKTDIPGLVLSQRGSSRIAFMPADLDRRYAREHLPDHATVLANVTRWAAGGNMPVRVEGPGFLDCHLYKQGGRHILHIVNLTSAGTWRAPVDELIPVGPIQVELPNINTSRARLLVSGGGTHPSNKLRIAQILDHEVILFE